MTIHTYPQAVDFSKYAADIQNPEIKYGLPGEVKFCKKCIISNQRPNAGIEFSHTSETKKPTIKFNDEGICDACLVTERKKSEIDWEKREYELRVLCDKYRSRNGSYDCVVPGSGGKDSFFAAHKLKYEYGMTPLTVTWAPHIYTDWGWLNFQRWIHSGFDNFLFTPNGRVHRLLTRLATETIFHPFQPFVLGQKNLAPRMSILHKIPLVFYGEQESEYGNPVDESNSAVRSWEYFTASDDKDISLGGTPLAALKADYAITNADIEPYMPVNPKDVQAIGTEVHYLGYYLKWHPQSCYYYAVEHGGFEAAPERTAGTYSKYSGIDDRIDDFLFYTTWIKFGIGRATYDAAQEIRSDDITRDEGVALVKRFDGEFPERFAEEIFRYLSLPEKEFPQASKMFEQPIMDRDYFFALQDRFRSPHLWQYENDEWALRKTVFGAR